MNDHNLMNESEQENAFYILSVLKVMTQQLSLQKAQSAVCSKQTDTDNLLEGMWAK